MLRFEPIAIVGRACILPAALSPAALWQTVSEGRVAIGPAPQDRWDLDARRLLRAEPSSSDDEFIASDRGGFVVDFAPSFAAAGFAEPIPQLEQLDPLVHWLLDCACKALQEAGYRTAPKHAGVIVGNLSYPTRGHSRFVEDFWLQQAAQGVDATAPDPRNRFSSGLPVHLVARALGLSGAAFAIDAACASSLYAIKLACDRLHDGAADLMLAGGVNRVDPLFIHLGFTALQALSPTGRSRPFHREADGLVPAEGCALVALKRLADAVRDGNTVYGVIRAVGLSNDGRGSGFLAPSSEGQVRAIRAAYEQSGLSPRDVGFIECHATGTARGDAVELGSLAAAWGDGPKPFIGSLKANIGHAITASGAASLIKILGAFEASVLPPTPSCDAPLDAVAEHGFRLLAQARDWDGAMPKRAAIDNFGFGGNNAHLIVEAWTGAAHRPAARASRPADPIALAAIGVVAGSARGLPDFVRRLAGAPGTEGTRTDEIVLPLAGLGFPPADLKASLAQQTAMLAAADEALAQVGAVLDPARTGVYVGMGCDTVVARSGLRLRFAALLSGARTANRESAPHLGAASVVGRMPNIPANRLHAQRDWRAPGFTVSSEELSGSDALTLAARALRAGEIDAALVGAADFSHEPAHIAAANALLPVHRRAAGDAAVALVLLPLAVAAARGLPVLATLRESDEPVAAAADSTLECALVRRFGHPHAASGLMLVTAAAVAADLRVTFDEAGAWPAPHGKDDRTRAVDVTSFSGQSARWIIGAAGEPSRLAAVAAPLARTYAAESRAALAVAVANDRASITGAVRLALVADDEVAFAALRARAGRALENDRAPHGPGIHFGAGGVPGDVAFSFTGAAAAYPGAGRALLLAFPEIGAALADRFHSVPALARKLYGATISEFTPASMLTASAFVSQAHAELTRNLLQTRAHAALGLSSGETNSLVAFGVWRDLDAMLAEIDASDLYGRALTGECRAAALHWGLRADERVAWKCWRIAGPVAAVEAALAVEPRAYMAIIYHDEDCLIAGDAAACDRVLRAVGRNRAIDVGLDMVVHCAPLAPFADAWRKLHLRPCHAAPGVRFYTHAGNRAYEPTSEAAADAITRQALEPIDFRRTVERAYADGVRVFVEHGPRGVLTSAVDRILVDRPHLAVALDRKEDASLKPLVQSLLALWAAGVNMQIAPLTERLARLRAEAAPRIAPAQALRLSAHWPDMVVPAAAAEIMAPPPERGFRYNLQDGAVPVRAEEERPERGGSATLTLIDMHRNFLAQQAEVHRAFLELRARGAAALARGRSDGPPQIALTRAQLEMHASGRVSAVFGNLFARQDAYARQVRMPEPPLLLADRVLVLEGEAGTLGHGRVVTQTDVREDAWYLHCGRMSPGAVIEAGQADLLLISYLGIDFLNQGERVYRLLGCDLTFHASLPAAGETLTYDIAIDEHAKSGDVRLFFFRYDCRVGDRLLISVRNGQAGFFSDADLAASTGVQWEAAGDPPAAEARVDPPPRASEKRSFSAADMQAFIAGDAYRCFGPGFEPAAVHTRTPGIPAGRLGLIDHIRVFAPRGGPWGRGYLKAVAHVPVDAWFYPGHFKNDPCMPGTLMADAATQALAFAMAALGFTLHRDGWRFEPVPQQTARFVCRGQVVPDRPHTLEYEVFIEEVRDGETPTVVAAVLCTSDGLKVFHCRRFALRLVPDWPLTTHRAILAGAAPARRVGPSGEARGDYGALIACAWGRPTDAFGPMVAPFDGPRRGPRLPAPPYHFMSRVVSVDVAPGAARPGATLVSEYDVPADAWYFAENGGQMPLAVVLETLLQPCGWLSAYLNFAAASKGDVAFRNLDGDDCKLHQVVTPTSGTLQVRTTLLRFAQAAASTICFFSVTCHAGGALVMSCTTDFGFFSPEALAAQVGLPTTDEMRLALTEPCPERCIDLTSASSMLARLPGMNGDRLRMLDSITGYWPQGGAQKLGRIRGSQRVPIDAWYFKAHFFQDPVQPGSLGLEALVQLARSLMALQGWADDITDPIHEPVALHEPLTWRYRGQVIPRNREVVTEIEALALDRAPGREVTLTARGDLWVDGLRIYETLSLAVRVRARRA